MARIQRASYLAGVAGWLQNDVNDALQGSQKVVTYTIGFSQGAADAAALLEETALREAGSTTQLRMRCRCRGHCNKYSVKFWPLTPGTSPPSRRTASIALRRWTRFTTPCFCPLTGRGGRGLKKLRIASDGRVVDRRSSSH